MKFQKGDIVLVGSGKVHWEVVGPEPEFFHGRYVLKSGLTGRRSFAYSPALKPWTPGA